MRILSWNVNGLRSAMQKGFLNWLNQSGADIVGIQEVRAQKAQLIREKRLLSAWNPKICAAERPGYSGVMLLSKRKPESCVMSLGEPRFDIEGRFMLAQFGRLLLGNIYFPNGNGTNRDNSRIPYKLDFYKHVFAFLEKPKSQGVPILIVGDFNTAHKEIDLARPKENKETSGFTPVEREEFDRWIRAGWIDTFRQFEPGAGHYSWWSMRAMSRARNVGWRIDYVLASPGAQPYLRSALIQRDIIGSDHCPVGVDVDDAIIG